MDKFEAKQSENFEAYTRVSVEKFSQSCSPNLYIAVEKVITQEVYILVY